MSDQPGWDEVLVERPTWSARRWLVVGLLVVLVVAAAAVVDRQVEQGEAAAVARCAERTHEAVALAQRRVTAMAGYVRPVLDNGAPARLRDQLYRMVSRQATGRDSGLRRVSAACAAVDVLPIHGELLRHRAACLGVLDRTAEHLRAVAHDGHQAFLAPPTVPTPTPC